MSAEENKTIDELPYLTPEEKHERKEGNCTPPAIEQFPEPLMNNYFRKRGGLIIHICVAIYMFVGLAIVCDDYFVPALDRIAEGRIFCIYSKFPEKKKILKNCVDLSNRIFRNYLYQDLHKACLHTHQNELHSSTYFST